MTFIFLTCIDHFWCSRNFSSSKSLQDLLLSSTTAVSEQSNMRFESERELCCRRSTPLSRLGRTGELEWAPLIADSGNPLLLSLLHPDELWQRGHLQLQAFLSSKCASRFFLFFFFVGRRDGRKAQGYLWSNHYTISSPQRPCCIHLSVGSPLSCSISPCHSPPLSPTRSLLLSFPIYLSSNLRLLCFSLYSVPQPDAL